MKTYTPQVTTGSVLIPNRGRVRAGETITGEYDHLVPHTLVEIQPVAPTLEPPPAVVAPEPEPTPEPEAQGSEPKNALVSLPPPSPQASTSEGAAELPVGRMPVAGLVAASDLARRGKGKKHKGAKASPVPQVGAAAAEEEKEPTDDGDDE